MKRWNEIGKSMPYHESDHYLNRLVDQVTEEAIKRRAAGPTSRVRLMVKAASAAAVALLVIGIGSALYHQHATAIPTQSPMDEFLGSLDDSEVEMLPCYEIEEIPEY